MKKHLTLSVLIIGMFASCLSPEQKKNIKRIDSLMVYIDSSQYYYSKIDSARLFKDFETYKKTEEEAGIYSANLKPKDASWDFLIPFANIQKPYKKALTRYIKFQDEISFSRNQLKNLRQDVKNELIDNKKFADYFQAESDAIGDMFMRIKFFNKDINYFTTRIDSLNKHVQPLLVELRKMPVQKSNKKAPSEEEDD